MMELLSLLVFLIYSLIILGILIYISPLLSAVIMILIPVVSLYVIQDGALEFFSIMQFSYAGIQVFNLHILLLVWSAFIGIIAYAEVLTWYLLKEKVQVPQAKEVSLPVNGDQPKTLLFKVNDFLRKLYKILKGEKIKSKSQ